MNPPRYSVLYYPKFEPSQRWLRSNLLFFDEIQRIIPPYAEHIDSKATQSLLGIMPNSLKTIAPEEGDNHFDEINFGRLEKACALIRGQTDEKPCKSFNMSIDPHGYISMRGSTWFSQGKLEERVRELLFQYDLATEFPSELIGGGPFGDTIPVNEEAGNLVVSYIADRIARRTGLDTITDVAIPYTLQSLDALNASSASQTREAEGLIASAVATLAVPANIERFTIHEYQELRQSFEAIRAPFHDLIQSLTLRSKVDRQQSVTAREIRIQQAVADYQNQMDDFKKSAGARSIDKWTPIAFQGLLSLILSNSQELVQFIGQATNLGIEVMKNIYAGKESVSPHEKTFRMLCRLGKKVDRKKIVNALA